MQERSLGFGQHIEGLFILSQALTLDPSEAAELVEEAIRRASASRDRAWTRDEVYRLILEAYRDRQEHRPVETSPNDAREPEYLKRQVEKLVDRVVPTTYARLPGSVRALLLLTEVEKRSLVEAAAILSYTGEDAARDLSIARESLEAAVMGSADPADRSVVYGALESGWIGEALRRSFQADFSSVPPTLRLSAASIGRGNPSEGRAAVYGYAHQKESPKGRGTVKILLVLLLIVVAGAVGLLLGTPDRPESSRDLIPLTAEQASSARVSFRTGSAEQAERYILDRTSWRVTIPEVQNATLQGLAMQEIAPDIEVPVLRFEELGGDPITMYVFTYAFLDQIRERVTIEEDVLRQIQDEAHFDIHDLGREKVIIWRSRDDIFVAVTSGDAESLRERIIFPS